MRNLLATALSLLVTTGVSSAADPGIIGGVHAGDLAAIISAHAWEIQARSLLAEIGATRVLTQVLYSDEAQSEATSVEPPTPAFAQQ
jgi:hypothetical protein